MRFGFDEISYKKTYLKYVWISIFVALLVIGLQALVTNYLSDMEFLVSIILPFAMVSGIYLMFSICTGLPFVIYISAKNFFRDGHISIEKDCLQFVRTCNIVDDRNNREDRKYKNTKFFNIDKITETKWCYKIKGEIDYFFEKPADRKKSHIIKHKKGTFRIPKCFGEEKEFKDSLYKLVNSERITSESINNEKYRSFTKEGFIDFLISILGSIIILFSNIYLLVLIGVTLSAWKGIKGINVLREQNRDRFFSIINIILALAGFILVVLNLSNG